MHIFIFYEFSDISIFDGLGIEIRQSTSPCIPKSDIAKTNIKIFYNENEDVDRVIDKLIERGCALIDRNPYLIVYKDIGGGVKIPRTIYYKDRIILDYKEEKSIFNCIQRYWWWS